MNHNPGSLLTFELDYTHRLDVGTPFFFFPLRAAGLCVFVVGVHSSSCGLCEDIGGCHADSHGKGSSWSYSFGLWVFLFALAELRGWVHGPAACIQLVTQSCFSKTNFMAVPEATLRKKKIKWKRCTYSHISCHCKAAHK